MSEPHEFTFAIASQGIAIVTGGPERSDLRTEAQRRADDEAQARRVADHDAERAATRAAWRAGIAEESDEDLLTVISWRVDTLDEGHDQDLAFAEIRRRLAAKRALPELATKIEAELAHRTRLDSKTWTEFESMLFAWYDATKP